MKVEIDRHQTISGIIRDNATCINNKFYYLPYWFEVDGDELYIHHFNDLPIELKDEIELMRSEIFDTIK